MRIRYGMLAIGLILSVNLGFPQGTERMSAWTARPSEGGFLYQIAGREYGPYGSIIMRPWIAPGFSQWAFAFQGMDGSQTILINGKEAARLAGYKEVGPIVLSPDGKDWAVRATDSQNKQFIIVSGRAYGPFNRVADAEFMGNRHWRCDIEEGKGKALLLDGTKYGPYSGGFREILFDRSGAPGFEIIKSDGTAWYWQGGKENGPYTEVEAVTDPAGKLMGYSGRMKTGKLELVIYGKKHGPYDYYLVDRLAASVDGKDWMILVTKAGKVLLLHNGKEASYNRCNVIRLSNGTLFSYEDGMNQYFNYNDKTLGPYETGRDFMVSSDRSTWAFTHIAYSKDFSRPDIKHIVINGVDYEGTSLAQGADSSGEFISWVERGVSAPAVYHRALSAPLTKTLYRIHYAENGTVYLDLGSRRLGPYEAIASQPSVSPDGAHWGVLASVGNGMVAPIIDGIEKARQGPYAKVSDFSIGASGVDYSFIALKIGNEPDNKTRVVDGKEYGPYTWAGQIWYGPSGGLWHLVAQTGGKDGGTYHVLSGKAFGPFAADAERSLVDLEKGLLIMVLKKSDGKYLYQNGVLEGPYKEIELLYGGEKGIDTPTENARYIAALAAKGNGDTVVLLTEGGRFGPYRINARDRRIWISPNENRYFIGLRTLPSGSLIIADAKEIPCDNFDLSPLKDGYALSRFLGKAAYYGANGAELGPYTRWNQTMISSDGSHWAVETGIDDGKSWKPIIVLDNREIPGDTLRRGQDSLGEYFSWIELDAANNGWLNVYRM